MKEKDAPKKILDPRIEEISKKLKEMRVAAGYTSYEKFTIEKGLPRVQYWRMEKGTNFQFESLIKILDAHEVSLSEFFANFTDIEEPKRNDL